MRKILFRGKSLNAGNMVYGDLIQWADGKTDIHVTMSDNKNKKYRFAVDPETVGQFTGLLDENLKRIFEGDILAYNDGFNYFKGEVVFENGAFGIGSDKVIELSRGCSDNFANLWQLFWDQECTDEHQLYYCKIIGNKYNNPELL